MSFAGWAFSLWGLIVLFDLVTGFRTGRMKVLLKSDRAANPTVFWLLVALGFGQLAVIASAFAEGGLLK